MPSADASTPQIWLAATQQPGTMLPMNEIGGQFGAGASGAEHTPPLIVEQTPMAGSKQHGVAAGSPGIIGTREAHIVVPQATAAAPVPAVAPVPVPAAPVPATAPVVPAVLSGGF